MTNIYKLLIATLLLTSFLIFPCILKAQVNCIPDSTFIDAPLGVYPTPFDSTVFPLGGLADFPATIGMPYDLTFTVKLTDSIVIPPFAFDLKEFALNNSNGLTGLPTGLEYSCNPPNCVFSDTTLGCILINGTPDESNPTGDYTLQIQGNIFSSENDSTLFNFPSDAFPGEYILSLNRLDSLGDADGDGILDSLDNCVNIPNPEQIDVDMDSFGAACDCNDTLSFVHPDAIEIQDNEIDDDCDGEIDEIPTFGGADGDNDGIPDEMDNCPELANADQTDEDNDGVGAACDCDDNGLTGSSCSEGCVTFFADNDRDGFGNPEIFQISCTAPTGFTLDGTDCDDSNPNINPLAQEIPSNGIDDNCNGLTDESSDPILWYLDKDGDGFGNPMIDSTSIAQPRGFVNNDEDCDDTNALIYNNALEIIDNLDNNCDGLVDNFEGICDDFTNAGKIGENQTVCPENPNPEIINNLEAPSGGSGDLEIMWMMTTENPSSGNAQWVLIPGSHSLSYDPQPISETTYFRRCARRKGCSRFIQETKIITITFSTNCDGEIIEITDPCENSDLTVSSEIIDPDCSTNNGSIDLSVRGGVMPYTFAWEPDFGNVEDIDSLPEGIYSASIFDALGCFSNFSAILSEPDTCMDPPESAPRGFEFGRVKADVINDKIVWLEWETINENKESQYLLEHSKEGKDFRVLPQVMKAKGNPVAHYQSKDEQPNPGTSFYRIKYLRSNGEYLYSPLVQVLVTPEGSPLFIAYPNPFGATLTIDFLKPLEYPIRLEILDNIGQSIFKTKVDIGEIRVTAHLPEAAKGLFTLQIINKRERIMKKILKM